MEHRTVYKGLFWFLLICNIIGGVIYIPRYMKLNRELKYEKTVRDGWSVEQIESVQRGWIKIPTVVSNNKEMVAFGPSEIYVTQNAREYPICSGCHARSDEPRKIDRELKCPTWGDNNGQ